MIKDVKKAQPGAWVKRSVEEGEAASQIRQDDSSGPITASPQGCDVSSPPTPYAGCA
jgi:hypothetical protein